jgi:hypothetical protein
LVLGIEFAGIPPSSDGTFSGATMVTSPTWSFRRARVLAVAAALGREIDDHRAGLHARDLGLADEFRRRLCREWPPW